MKTLCAVALLLVSLFSMAAPSQASTQAALDRTDAASTARALLKAYAAKDLAAMSDLSNADNREIIRELIAQGEEHPRWRSIFTGGRWQAVSTWDGKLGEVRYFERTAFDEKHYEARVQFGETTPDKLVVVVLTWENGKWCFEDVNFPRRESFEQGSKTRPRIP